MVAAKLTIEGFLRRHACGRYEQTGCRGSRRRLMVGDCRNSMNSIMRGHVPEFPGRFMMFFQTVMVTSAGARGQTGQGTACFGGQGMQRSGVGAAPPAKRVTMLQGVSELLKKLSG
jgi:hypothetical protein